MRALFVGAGFSKWASGLPLVDELFNFNIPDIYPVDVKKIEILAHHKKKWDDKNPKGHPEAFIADILNARGIASCKDALIWFLSRKVAVPFIAYYQGKRSVPAFDVRYNFPGKAEASSYIKGFSNLSGIISTNYDILIEYALGPKGFYYDIPGERLKGRGSYPVSQYIKPIILTGKIPLAKLHGSISWDKEARYTDGRRGITGGALIVPPALEKKPQDLLRPLWNLAQEIIKKSEEIIFFGFSFNPYDKAIGDFLEKSGRHIKLITLIDPAPQCSRAKRIFPNADIRTESPSSLNFSQIQN